MRILLIGDLHLSERSRDAYRFGIFKWVAEQQKQFNPHATIFMGDITDRKDKHSSILVNRIVDEFTKLERYYVLMGNHDYIDPSSPFFKFLGNRFIYEATQIGRLLFIPHTHSKDEFATICNTFKHVEIDYVFCHQTFEGAIAETGARLNGLRQAYVDALQPRLGVYAGDIHRPQRAGNVVYVGSPYHIRFGDDFDPRCILLDDKGHAKNLYFDSLRKWSLTVRDPADILKNRLLFKNDQVVLTIELAREESVDWKAHKRAILEACKQKGLEVFGVDLKVNSTTPSKAKENGKLSASTPETIVDEFCRVESLPKPTKQAGHDLLRE